MLPELIQLYVDVMLGSVHGGASSTDSSACVCDVYNGRSDLSANKFSIPSAGSLPLQLETLYVARFA